MSKCDDVCLHCGLSADEHHAFVSLESTRPKGCKCDLRDWDHDKVTQVCSAFVADDSGYEMCRNCEHYENCHG